MAEKKISKKKKIIKYNFLSYLDAMCSKISNIIEIYCSKYCIQMLSLITIPRIKKIRGWGQGIIIFANGVPANLHLLWISELKKMNFLGV